MLFSAVLNVLMLTSSVYMLHVYDRALMSGSIETLLYLTIIAVASVLHGCTGWRRRRSVSMLRISPSCRTNTMPTVATILRGRSDA
jgi:ABC-type protease/lipase transport system fused ATPase/permease subunit